MSQFLKGGEGVGFFIFVTISYVIITLGVWGGFSPNLINVTHFTLFFIAGFPYRFVYQLKKDHAI